MSGPIDANTFEEQSDEGYVKTAAYNYTALQLSRHLVHAVSRKASVCGAENVEMKGKSIIHSGACLRGDFQTIRIGRYCNIGENCILRPPSYQASLNPEDEEPIKFLPLVIGSHTRIGKDCVIEAAAIGASVYIGENCVISKRVIVKDCCYIEPGTVIAQDMVIPPFSRVRGCPGRLQGLMPESVAVTFPEDCVDLYGDLVRDNI